MKEILGIKLYNVKETLEILGVTAQTVRLYIKQEKLRGVKIGKEWFVSETAIRFFITGGITVPPKGIEIETGSPVPSSSK